MPSIHSVALTPHPSTSGSPVRSVAARLSRARDGNLTVTYTIEGDLHRLALPALAHARFSDGLWRHTCCELFVRQDGLAAYHEVNLSPSGEWAAYAFERYREGIPLTDAALDPEVAVRRRDDELDLEAVIRLDRLLPASAGDKLSLGLSAVIEDADGALSYWALCHPSHKPDFHHPDSFSLRI